MPICTPSREIALNAIQEDRRSKSHKPSLGLSSINWRDLMRVFSGGVMAYRTTTTAPKWRTTPAVQPVLVVRPVSFWIFVRALTPMDWRG